MTITESDYDKLMRELGLILIEVIRGKYSNKPIENITKT